MSQTEPPARTSVALRGDTHREFTNLKPDELSADEFVRVLLNRWEGKG